MSLIHKVPKERLDRCCDVGFALDKKNTETRKKVYPLH